MLKDTRTRKTRTCAPIAIFLVIGADIGRAEIQTGATHVIVVKSLYVVFMYFITIHCYYPPGICGDLVIVCRRHDLVPASRRSWPIRWSAETPIALIVIHAERHATIAGAGKAPRPIILTTRERPE